MNQIKMTNPETTNSKHLSGSTFLFQKVNRKSYTFLFILTTFLVVFSENISAQQDAPNNRPTAGDVNENTNVSFNVPLASYPGRGLDLPVSLTYSSDVWSMKHKGVVNNFSLYSGQSGSIKQSVVGVTYAKHSTAGWKSSLDLPTIEFENETYNPLGGPKSITGCASSFVRVSRLYVHMPDGSTHEMRKDDIQYQNNGVIDVTGTFYSVDGSRMKYIGVDGDTGHLIIPDGTRYELGYTNPQTGQAESRIIDVHGNRQTYNHTTRQWTDTLGRVISNPLPLTPSEGNFPYHAYGINGSLIEYRLVWKKLEFALSPVNGSTPELSWMASHYLPSPDSPMTNSQGGNFPQPHSSSYGSLFYSAATPESEEVPTYVVGQGQTSNARFNPVVLAEVILPNGTSYKFGYNVYGEIDKVTYPTNAYEKYEYASSLNSAAELEFEPYIQAERILSSRKLSINGTGNDITTWKYISDIDYGSGGGVIKIIAPDNTRTEIYKFAAPPPGHSSPESGIYWSFGYADSRRGATVKKDFYSNSTSEGTGGVLLRRNTTEYDQTTYSFPVACGNTYRTVNSYRNLRPIKSTNVVLEGSATLAQTQTYEYDENYEMTTGVDQTIIKTYHYVVPTDLNNIPLGNLASSTHTTFENSPYLDENFEDIGYRARNILGIKKNTEVWDNNDVVVSRSEIIYDEPDYSPEFGRALPTSSRIWDSTKGVVTNNNAYLTTHAKFDAFGNRTQAIDAKGITTHTEYDTNYHVFPIKVLSAIPEPTLLSSPDNLSHGSQSASETKATFDFTTGLTLTTTDINNQTTTLEYDAYLRLKKVTPPTGAGLVEIIYNDAPGNIWVKNKTQIDQANWAENITYLDGIGRSYKIEKTHSKGNIFTDTEFDAMGRVKQTTNPYRSGESKRWTTLSYDKLGRILQTTTPDGGILENTFGISATINLIGTTKIVTDQAGRKRKSITDSLGRVFCVIEDPDGLNLHTNYIFDTTNNLRETIQGEQHRYFMYDSLGRLLRTKQPEQEANSALTLSTADPVTNNNQWSVGYWYDDNGNITKTTDARNVSVIGTYDQLNRLIYRNYSDTTPDVSFFYDGKGLAQIPQYSNGKMTKYSSSVSETRYVSFDNLGRLLMSQQLTTTDQRVGTQLPYISSYTYNLAGALMTETYPSGRVVLNSLNTNGELDKVESQKTSSVAPKLYLSNIEYTAFGAIGRSRLGNGRWEMTQYDPDRLQIKELSLGNSDTDKSLLKTSYHYGTATENNGSLREQKIIYAGQTSQISQLYTYDSLNRLQSATEIYNTNQQSWKQTFSYDRYGNRNFNTVGNNTTTLNLSKSVKITNPTINSSDNRLKNDQEDDSIIDYGYDKNGSLVLDAEGRRFTYDAESRQTQFFGSTNASQTPDGNYQYDGEGQRVRKISGQSETIFVYNSSGALVAEYSTQISSTPQVSYLTMDTLGSPRIITDNGGMVVSRHDYMTFGDEIYSNTGGRTVAQKYSATDNIRQQYTSYERDNESGLDYAQARQYNSMHGRFTSVDPLMASATIKNPQTFNRYSYVLNSPYKFTDPLGLFGISSGGSRQGDVLPLGNYDIDPSRFSGVGLIAQNDVRNLYIFVGFTQAEMTAQANGKTLAPPDFSSLIAAGKAAGINVEIHTTDSVAGIELDDTPLGEGFTKDDLFVKALQDPKAVGVIFVGHSTANAIVPSGEFAGTPIVEGVSIAGDDENDISATNMQKIAGVQTKLIGIFSCDSKQIALSFLGSDKSSKVSVIATDGGKNGQTSIHLLVQGAYSAANEIINGKTAAEVTVKANATFTKLKALKFMDPDTKKLNDIGDSVKQIQ